MRYLLAHRTKRILFLFVLLPTAAVAYMTLPRGDVRLPAENVRARTQDIAIPASAPSVARGKFMEPPRAYVSQGAAVRTPADEAAISELALATAATPPDVTARLTSSSAPQVTTSTAATETSTQPAPRGQSSSSNRAYPELLARGMEWASLGVSGTSRSSGAEATAGPTQTALTTQTTTNVTTPTASTSTATTTSSSTSTSTSSASTGTRGPAAPPAVVAGGQSALENTDDTAAEATVAEVFSGPAGGSNGKPNNGTPGGPPTSGSPSPTPEPATLLLMAGGLAIAYGARRYVL
jgi:PEP-CTERM motif